MLYTHALNRGGKGAIVPLIASEYGSRRARVRLQRVAVFVGSIRKPNSR